MIGVADACRNAAVAPRTKQHSSQQAAGLPSKAWVHPEAQAFGLALALGILDFV